MKKWYCVALVSLTMVAEESYTLDESELSAAPVEPAETAPIAREVVAGTVPTEWQVAEDTGLTTTVLDNRGNWYNKQRILAEARKVFESVRSTVNAIDGIIREFMEQHNQLTSTIAQFYIDLGTTEAALTERITVIIESLQKEEKAGTLSEQERLDLQKFLDQKSALEDIFKMLKKVQTLDEALNKASQVIGEQLSVAHSYEEVAWENYDKIADVLNDDIAEGYLKQVQGALSNVEAIQQYLIREFSPYFASMANQLKDSTQSITKQVEDLQRKGLELIQEFKQSQELPEAVVKTEPVEVKVSWWQSLINSLGSAWQTIVGFFKGLFGFK